MYTHERFTNENILEQTKLSLYGGSANNLAGKQPKENMRKK